MNGQPAGLAERQGDDLLRASGDLHLLLRGALDGSWWRYLWNTLADPLSLNLRDPHAPSPPTTAAESHQASRGLM